MLAVAGATVTLGIMALVLAVPALDACAPKGTPAIECLATVLRERLPLIREPGVLPALPLRDPRKTAGSRSVTLPADSPRVEPSPPGMLKVDLPVSSPAGLPPAAPDLVHAAPPLREADSPVVVPAAPQVTQPAAAELAVPAASIDPVTANAVPSEPQAEIARLVPAPPVTLPPQATPPMPAPIAVAAPAVAPAPDVPAPRATETVTLPPTIDTIQIGGTDNFVAGDAPAGSKVRLYLDDQPAGESEVEDGRWLIEGVELTSAPMQILKVEAIDPASGDVLGTGAISVEIELPDDVDLPPAGDDDSGPAEGDGAPAAAPKPDLVPAVPPASPDAAPATPTSDLAPRAPSLEPEAAGPTPSSAPIPSSETLEPLAPLVQVKPRGGSRSVQLLSGGDGGSFVTLGK